MNTRIQRHLMLFAAVIALVFFNSIQSLATDYVILDLGVLTGTKSEAWGINNNNDVVGLAYLNGDAVNHAFLYRGGIMTDLGVATCTDPNGKSNARRINDAGQIAGKSCFWLPGNADRAFLYDAGVMTDLGTLGGTASEAWGINKSGHVAGTAAISGDAAAHAFLSKKIDGIMTMTDLHTLGGAWSWAYDINDSDQVVGESRYSTAAISHAFLYDNGVMTDLTPSLNGDSKAWSINNAGQIVGTLGSGGGSHAFLYIGGTLTDLGAGPFSLGCEAMAINNNGMIVGWFYVSVGTHAFLYKDGSITDLNNVLPAGSGWVLNYAYDINDQGRIAGIGTINGHSHGFVAAPAYPGDFAPADCDVDGSDLAALIALEIATFAQNFGKNICQ
jgi:probable HAF family extracellular repeat protein